MKDKPLASQSGDSDARDLAFTPPQSIFRLDELKLTNIFGFKEAEFRFHPSLNIVVGVNGAGKTSLLRAIAGAIALPINGVSRQSSFWLLEDSSATRSEILERSGRVRLEKCFPARIDARGAIRDGLVSWNTSKSGGASSGAEWSGGLYKVFEQTYKSGSDYLPVAAFYSADRRWTAKPVSAESSVSTADARTNGYLKWENAAADVDNLQRWVIAKSLERFEVIANQPNVPNEGAMSGDELSIVNRAVMAALPGSKGIRFDMRFRQLVVDWDSRPSTPFEELSDGQRGICALVADIARRMCLLNPQAGAEVTSVTPGIVVIDELDMHLHPAWQRRIVHILRETFPLVQFFAATHSPQIIGEVSAANILMLKRDGTSGHPERSLGLDSSEVLEEVMGSDARNQDVERELSEIQTLIDDDNLDEAEARLNDLSSKVGDIPEVTQLQGEIRSLRILGEGEE